MSDNKPKCFIIMPLTTPKEHLTNYNGDDEHFHHVLEHLFLPAVEQAGFDPIKPIAKGSENIQARIIKKLETADLVLCDMSILNPNVFFEFGIRTALNKPVCVVVDDKTPRVPFDTGTINYHKYKSSMSKWEVETEINTLTKHIIESKEQIEDGNALWKYFGLSNTAKLVDIEDPTQSGINLILTQLNLINRKISAADIQIVRDKLMRKEIGEKITKSFLEIRKNVSNFEVGAAILEPDTYYLWCKEPINNKELKYIRDTLYDFSTTIRVLTIPSELSLHKFADIEVIKSVISD